MPLLLVFVVVVVVIVVVAVVVVGVIVVVTVVVVLLLLMIATTISWESLSALLVVGQKAFIQSNHINCGPLPEESYESNGCSPKPDLPRLCRLLYYIIYDSIIIL